MSAIKTIISNEHSAPIEMIGAEIFKPSDNRITGKDILQYAPLFPDKAIQPLVESLQIKSQGENQKNDNYFCR